MALPRCALQLVFIAVVGASSLTTRSAHAGDGGDGDPPQVTTDPAREREKAAEVLFDEGRSLMQAGRFAEACPKLKESQDLDPALGTLVNLGLCYEKSGLTASAWAVFRDAASQAAAKGDDERERYARERASAIEPSLAKLALVVSEAAIRAGVQVRRDGAAIPRAEWGVEAPVDPGEHVVEATAGGRRPWRTRVVATAQHTLLVHVPDPEPEAPAAGPAQGASELSRTAGSWRRPTALAVGGAGVIGLVVGTIAALSAVSKYHEADDQCHGDACSSVGLEVRDRALTLADVATVSFVTGSVLVVGGLVLWLTTPRGKGSAQHAPLWGQF